MAVQRSRQLISKLTRNRAPRPVIGKQAQAILDALPAYVALLDAAATIIAANAAWHRFVEAHGYAGADHGVGSSYLQICENACGADARAAEHAIGVILAREQAEYCYEYACGSPDQQRWFLFRATWLPATGPIRVMISHEDITHLKAAQERARSLEMAQHRDRQQNEQALDQTKDRLQALPGQVQPERERRREITRQLADDGVGFNPSPIRRPTQRWSLGLMTMQERAAAVGGRLVIDSAPGQGSRIAVDVAR